MDETPPVVQFTGEYPEIIRGLTPPSEPVPLTLGIGGPVIGSIKIEADEQGWKMTGSVTDPENFPGWDRSLNHFSIGPVPVFHEDSVVYVGGGDSYVVPELHISEAEEQAARYARQMLWLENNYGYFSNDYYQVRRAWAEYREQFDDSYLKALVEEAFNAIYNPS